MNRTGMKTSDLATVGERRTSTRPLLPPAPSEYSVWFTTISTSDGSSGTKDMEGTGPDRV